MSIFYQIKGCAIFTYTFGVVKVETFQDDDASGWMGILVKRWKSCNTFALSTYWSWTLDLNFPHKKCVFSFFGAGFTLLACWALCIHISPLLPPQFTKFTFNNMISTIHQFYLELSSKTIVLWSYYKKCQRAGKADILFAFAQCNRSRDGEIKWKYDPVSFSKSSLYFAYKACF